MSRQLNRHLWVLLRNWCFIKFTHPSLNVFNMPENCSKNAEKPQNERRIIPGGYFCNAKFDEIAMYNADILRALDAITGANTNREEIYRLVARIYDQVHKSNKVLSELRMIYK